MKHAKIANAMMDNYPLNKPSNYKRIITIIWYNKKVDESNSEALLRMVAPGAGFRDGTLFRTKNRWRPKKRSPLQNKWVFGPKVYVKTKKKKLFA